MVGAGLASFGLLAILLLPSLGAAAPAGHAGAPPAPVAGRSGGTSVGPATAPPRAEEAFGHVHPGVSEVPTNVSETVELTTGSIVAGNALPTNLIGLNAPPAVIPGTSLVVGTADAGQNTTGEVFEFNATSGSVERVAASARAAPEGAAYDPASGTVWVASLQSSPYYGPPYLSNVSVYNAGTLGVVRTLLAGNASYAVAYDPMGQRMMVTNLQSNDLWAYNSSTYGVVKVPVGGDPVAVAYDGPDGLVVVANAVTDNLTVLNATTLAEVRTIPIANAPDALLVAANGTVYVAQHNASEILTVDPSTGTVTGKLGAPYGVTSLALDPTSSLLYATGGGPGGNVSVTDLASRQSFADLPISSGAHQLAYSTTADRLVVLDHFWSSVTTVQNLRPGWVFSNVTVGRSPQALAFDETDARLFLADGPTGAVTYLGSNGSSLAGFGSLWAEQNSAYATWDSTHDTVWFGAPTNTSASVFNASTLELVRNFSVGHDFGAAVFDQPDGKVYIANPTGNKISAADGRTFIVDPPIPTVGYPESLAFDPDSDVVFVGAGVIYNFVPSSSIGFVGGASETSLGTVQSGGFIAAMAYDPLNHYVYAFNQLSNNFTVINGTNRHVVTTLITTSPWADYGSAAVYDPITNLVYVSRPTLNAVWMLNATSLAFEGAIPVGSEPTGLAYDYADGYVAVANSGSGTISLIRDPVRIPVTFSETGLPNGTWWGIRAQSTVRYSNTSSVTFFAPPGTFAYSLVSPQNYSVAAGQESGTLHLTAGTVTVPLAFNYSGPLFAVQFNSLGLPFLTTWAVTVGTTTLTSTGANLLFHLAPGRYDYVVPGIPGYTPTPSSGNFTVVAQRVNLSAILWSATTFALTFTETGLPAGTTWGVELTSNLINHTQSAVAIVNAPNGSYHATVLAVRGYLASPSSIPINVTGSGGAWSIVFSVNQSTPSGPSGSASAFTGITPVEGLGLAVLAGILIVLGVIVEIRDRRQARRLAQEGEAPPAEEPGA